MAQVEDNALHSLDIVLSEVRKHVAEFSDNRELADDCTMLAIRRQRTAIDELIRDGRSRDAA